VPVGKMEAKVAEPEAALTAQGATARGYCADVTQSEALTIVVTQTIAQHGRIDILVNSQGVTILKPAEELSRADYDRVMATNLTSVFFSFTEVGRHMLERGGGSIINIASLAAHRGFQLSVLYTMSKHGVLALARTLAAEWTTRGGRVNAVSPGFFMRTLNRDKMSASRKEIAMRHATMKRFGEVEELLESAEFSASLLRLATCAHSRRARVR
jgi:gluconate 5-dehydrogenase